MSLEYGILIIIGSFVLAIVLAWRGAQKEKQNDNHFS
jgi:prolipoprotein diacylglyceryltransferase